ncbi:MAG: hypothetical protein GTO60_12670 [Gammaproteobacteria bacterium]|nr:hypothetical protein [Gammaproteobacteria bacterium]
MEVYRFGTTDAWDKVSLDTDTCSSADANADCTLSGHISASKSEYYEQDGSNYWIYFRVWQTENTASETLKTDSFNVSFSPPVEITLEGYTFENDDEDQSTGDAVDENTVQAGSSFSSGKTISNVKKGERLTVRAHINNTGGDLYSNLALFYDRNDNIWTKVEDRPLAGTFGSSCGAGASSDFGCTIAFDGGDSS